MLKTIPLFVLAYGMPATCEPGASTVIEGVDANPTLQMAREAALLVFNKYAFSPDNQCGMPPFVSYSDLEAWVNDHPGYAVAIHLIALRVDTETGTVKIVGGTRRE